MGGWMHGVANSAFLLGTSIDLMAAGPSHSRSEVLRVDEG